MALDRNTGKLLWETAIADHKKGYSGTVAPLAVKNMVLVGTAGAEFGIRGFVDAYDAATGKRAVALPHRAGARANPAAILGQRCVDARRRLHLDHRHLRPRAEPDVLGHGQSRSRHERRRPSRRQPLHVQRGGARRRHRQAEVAFPIHPARRARLGRHQRPGAGGPDYRRTQSQGPDPGESQRALLCARPNQRQIPARAGLHAGELDRRLRAGRPAAAGPGQDPSEDGTQSCPGLGGGHNWQATAYSPQTGLYYFGSTDGCHTVLQNRPRFRRGAMVPIEHGG